MRPQLPVPAAEPGKAECPTVPAGSSDLDDLLDDAIVEAAWRRRIFPRRALTQVVHRLRAERRLMVGLDRLVQPGRKESSCPPHLPKTHAFLPLFCLFYFPPSVLPIFASLCSACFSSLCSACF